MYQSCLSSMECTHITPPKSQICGEPAPIINPRSGNYMVYSNDVGAISKSKYVFSSAYIDYRVD